MKNYFYVCKKFETMNIIERFLENKRPFAIGKIFNTYFMIAMYRDYRILGIRCSKNTYQGVVTKDLNEKEISYFKIIYNDYFTRVYNDELNSIYELKNNSFKEYFLKLKQQIEEAKNNQITLNI